MSGVPPAPARARSEGPATDEKITFLARPGSYSLATTTVEIVETHMTWVFLTERFAYKLKKPVRQEFLDFTTLTARRRACEAEVRLNRRLAPDVYLGAIPLARTPDGGLEIGGGGRPVDWLVHMRRLPAHRMLDRMILDGTLRAEDVREIARTLADFYRRRPRVPLSPDRYPGRLLRDLRRDLGALLEESDGHAPHRQVKSLAREQLRFLRRERALLEERIRAGYLVDGHGDLRAEHVCLERPPVVIDCVEFERDFRILDPAHDLAFLALECERLGAAWVGESLFATYAEVTGDHVPPRLVKFYESVRAVLRAKLAIWHLRDDGRRRPGHWIDRCGVYLELASACLARSA